jgi:hypothetical protein
LIRAKSGRISFLDVLSAVPPFSEGRFAVYIQLGFHMIVTVVKIESRPFASAEMQHFRIENTRSDYN